MRRALAAPLLLLMLQPGTGQPPSPGTKSLSTRPSDGATPAEVRAWIRQTLADREGHAIGHIRWLERALGRWFFNTDDGVHGAELWESDLTVDGTRLLLDIRPGPGGSFPHHKCEYNGRLYFAADDGVSGIELWETDGSANGTRLFADLFEGAGSSYVQGMIACGGTMYFAAATAADGYELWASDGTVENTRMLQDITPGRDSSHITDTRCDRDAGVLFFTIHHRFRWRTDGTRMGTRLATEAETGLRTEL